MRVFDTTCLAYQLVQEADVNEVTSAGVWDHFKAVIVPAIMQWQAVREEEPDESNIGNLLVQYALFCQERRENSKVGNPLLTHDAYMCCELPLKFILGVNTRH